MLKTRKYILTENGAYQGVYGRGDGNWVYGGEALAVILTHKLLSVRGEILNHADFGITWFKQSDYKQTFDTQIRQMVLADERVISILDFNSNLDLQNREYRAKLLANTTEGLLQLAI